MTPEEIQRLEMDCLKSMGFSGANPSFNRSPQLARPGREPRNSFQPPINMSFRRGPRTPPRREVVFLREDYSNDLERYAQERNAQERKAEERKRKDRHCHRKKKKSRSRSRSRSRSQSRSKKHRSRSETEPRLDLPWKERNGNGDQQRESGRAKSPRQNPTSYNPALDCFLRNLKGPPNNGNNNQERESGRAKSPRRNPSSYNPDLKAALFLPSSKLPKGPPKVTYKLLFDYTVL